MVKYRTTGKVIDKNPISWEAHGPDEPGGLPGETAMTMPNNKPAQNNITSQSTAKQSVPAIRTIT